MLGDLFNSQKLQKYPFRKSKGLFSRGFILVMNLLVDVLVKKSVALLSMQYPKVLERVDSPEQIFYRSFLLGALGFLQFSKLWEKRWGLFCSKEALRRYF